ncbi:MAG TPA: metallophosphoesterase [Candidatus Nanoarchaeia archaeon]|nr:metallophosphoesterase [Candidatus Nanoarchaeia archaeon]
MRLLLTGDFGGVFPDKVFNAMRKEQFDFVLCMGDFGDIHYLRELFLTYGEKIMEHVTEEECILVYEKGIQKARDVFAKLNSFGRPVYLCSGNNEFKAYELFVKTVAEYPNLYLIDNKMIKWRALTILGMRYPAPSPTEQKSGITIDKLKNMIKNTTSGYLREKAPSTLLLCHVPPFNCTLDKLPKNTRLNPGKHIGSKLVAELVQTYNPALVVCGHLEELQGECRFSRSRIINPGGAENGRYALMEIGKSIKDARLEFKQVSIRNV